MSPDLIDGRYRPIFFYYGSLSTVFFSECNPIDRRYRPYHSVSVSNPIDCWYQPYSVVSVILSTVDIDRDQSTGRLKSHRPIDDTCGILTPSTQSNLFPNLICFFLLKLTKFPHYYTKYFLNRFIPHVYRARLTHGPWPGSKKVWIWPKLE